MFGLTPQEALLLWMECSSEMLEGVQAAYPCASAPIRIPSAKLGLPE